MKILIRGELPALAERARFSAQMIGIRDLARPALGARRDRSERVHHELVSARQAEMRGVVADAKGKPLVVRMVGVLLGSGSVDIIRVPVRPRRDGMATPPRRRIVKLGPLVCSAMLNKNHYGATRRYQPPASLSRGNTRISR